MRGGWPLPGAPAFAGRRRRGCSRLARSRRLAGSARASRLCLLGGRCGCGRGGLPPLGRVAFALAAFGRGCFGVGGGGGSLGPSFGHGRRRRGRRGLLARGRVRVYVRRRGSCRGCLLLRRGRRRGAAVRARRLGRGRARSILVGLAKRRRRREIGHEKSRRLGDAPAQRQRRRRALDVSFDIVVLQLAQLLRQARGRGGWQRKGGGQRMPTIRRRRGKPPSVRNRRCAQDRDARVHKPVGFLAARPE